MLFKQLSLTTAKLPAKINFYSLFQSSSKTQKFQKRCSSKFVSCKIGVDGDSLDLDHGQGHITRIASVRLRDNSPLEQDSASFGRKLLMSDLDLRVRVEEISPDVNGVEVKLSDGHSSFFSFQWLNERVNQSQGRHRYFTLRLN